MKTLQLFDNFSGNGTERVFESTIPHLSALGIEMAVVALNAATLRWGEVELHGLRRYSPESRFSPFRFFASRLFTEWRFIDRIIRTEKPDLIHGHFTFSQMVSASISKKHNIPYVLTYHMGCLPKDNLSKRNQAIFSRIQERSFRNASLLVAVSPETQTLLSRAGYSNTIVLENPLPDDLIGASFLSKKQYDLCFCGRLTPDKAPITTLDLCRRLRDLGKPVRMAFIGSGSAAQQMKDYAAEHKLDVTFFGHLSHKKCIEILASSRVFHSPSLFEAFGLSTLEAIAVGCFCMLNDIPVYRRFEKSFDGVTVVSNSNMVKLVELFLSVQTKEPVEYVRDLSGYSAQTYSVKLVEHYNRVLNSDSAS